MRFPFLTSYLQLINLFTTVFTTTIVFCILVANYYEKELIFIIVIGLCLCLISWRFGRDISKNSVFWRFVLISLCGVVAKISVFGMRDRNFLQFYYCFIIFNVTSLFLYIPTHSFDGNVPYHSKWINNLIIVAVLVANCLVLVILIVQSSGLKHSEGALDCTDGWKRFIKSYKDQTRERRINVPDRQPGNQMLVTAARRLIKDYAPVPKDAPKNQTPKLSKCPICSSDVATLRILTECGHTVCEECARKIVDKTCNDKCPVCRQVDDIDEPASRDVGPSAPVEELEDNRPENRPVCKQETIVDETEKVDIPASSDVGPSAPVEELEDHRPENRTPLHCECPICTEEYSDTVIPRILTQCGHTVCEECARKLLGHQGNITCPVCREETNVDGRVENLPKNFAVIEMARGN